MHPRQLVASNPNPRLHSWSDRLPFTDTNVVLRCYDGITYMGTLADDCEYMRSAPCYCRHSIRVVSEQLSEQYDRC